MEMSKSDWKLYRQKIAGWQEAYIERLNKEYIDLLSVDEKRRLKNSGNLSSELRRIGVIRGLLLK